MKKAAIIVVNWNGRKFLKNCFNSVFKQTYKNFEVYFVDNGSVDDSSNYVKTYFPKVNIIQLDRNYGFAKGNNEGIRESFKDKKVEYIVCLNNDTIVDKNWLKELVKTAEKDKKIGAVGSKILFFYDKNKINSLGIIPLKNGNALNLSKNMESNKFEEEIKIFGPCGASALYKRNALDKIGLFDEKYFCYLEDVDLAWRINLAGYKSILNPKSVVFHIHSGTSSNYNSLKEYLITRNSLYNLIKYSDLMDVAFYPFNMVRYYNLFKEKKSMKSEVMSISKKRFFANFIVSLFYLLIHLPNLINSRSKNKTFIKQNFEDINKFFIYN